MNNTIKYFLTKNVLSNWEKLYRWNDTYADRKYKKTLQK